MVDLASTTNTASNLSPNSHGLVSVNNEANLVENGVFSFKEQAKEQQFSVVNPHFIEPHNGGNMLQYHPENNPSNQTSQYAVLPSRFTAQESCQKVAVGLSGLCTVPVIVQTARHRFSCCFCHRVKV